MSHLLQSTSLGCYLMLCYHGPKGQAILNFGERHWNHGTRPKLLKLTIIHAHS